MIHQLEADSISIHYENRAIITGGYLKAETGKITGLLGRNGYGKSSLLKALFGAVKAEYKSVRVDQKWIPDLLSVRNLAAYLPQHSFVPDYLNVQTVFDLYGTDFEKISTSFPELKTCYTQKTGQLSGGERRLVETLLILFRPVQFVLLDEPFSFLSPVLIERLLVIIQEEKRNKSIIITDHLYKTILRTCDDLYLISNQRTYLIRTPEELVRWGYLPDE